MKKTFLRSLLLFFILFSSSFAEKLIIEPDMGPAPLLSAIKNTKSSIQMVMYGLTDADFIKALIDAKVSGKKVEVLLEKTPYRNESENIIAQQALQAANINIKWSNPDFKLTHQKTIIFDDHDAVIMTFNLTHSAFKTQRNFALLIDDPGMINEIKRVFQADANHQSVIVNNPDLVWSPDNSRKKLLDFIDSAKSSIEIYAQGITDYKTIGALARAAKKGISVQIITSNIPNKETNKYSYLKKSGVRIYYNSHYYIHAKVIIIDHQTAMLGSINLTQPSIDDNRELSVITRNKDTIRELEKIFGIDSSPSWEGRRFVTLHG